jgi:hypothetical protein
MARNRPHGPATVPELGAAQQEFKDVLALVSRARHGIIAPGETVRLDVSVGYGRRVDGSPVVVLRVTNPTQLRETMGGTLQLARIAQELTLEEAGAHVRDLRFRSQYGPVEVNLRCSCQCARTFDALYSPEDACEFADKIEQAALAAGREN